MREKQAKDGETDYDDKHVIRDRKWTENCMIISVFLNSMTEDHADAGVKGPACSAAGVEELASV